MEPRAAGSSDPVAVVRTARTPRSRFPLGPGCVGQAGRFPQHQQHHTGCSYPLKLWFEEAIVVLGPRQGSWDLLCPRASSCLSPPCRPSPWVHLAG